MERTTSNIEQSSALRVHVSIFRSVAQQYVKGEFGRKPRPNFRFFEPCKIGRREKKVGSYGFKFGVDLNL